MKYFERTMDACNIQEIGDTKGESLRGCNVRYVVTGWRVWVRSGSDTAY